MYTIRVFISHSWAYSDHYDCLAGWIFEEGWQSNGTPIDFIDTSVPKDNPIHFAENEEQLRRAIYARIAQSHVVVIPTGMYAHHSNWIGKEIAGSQALNKPILAVNPWGQEKKSSVVVTASNEHVGWNKQSVIDGIWRLSPHG